MKQIRFAQAQEKIEEGFSIDDLDLDLTRNFADYIRQSKRGASTMNGESRETQLALVRVARNYIKKRKANILVEVFDEEDNISGTKGEDERDELFKLLARCKAGYIGTLFLTFEDRLYRDEYGDESGKFLRIAAQQRITVVVPIYGQSGTIRSFKVYRLWLYDDRERFKEAMKIAAAQLNHVRNMNSKGRQKAARGCYDGRHLPPGLFIPTPPKKMTKEQKKEWKRNLKPVIYQPWATVMQEIFKELQTCNWDIPRVFRAIHARETPLFPEIRPEDEAKYIIHHSLKPIKIGEEKGYTVGSITTLRRWITNYHLIGWWATWSEEDENTGEEIPGAWICDNHPAVLDRAVFEEGHMKLTGYTLENEPVPHMRIKLPTTRHTSSVEVEGPLLLELLRYPDDRFAVRRCTLVDKTGEIEQFRPAYRIRTKAEDELEGYTLFIISSSELDTIIIRRIEEFCTVDLCHDMAQRVKNRLEQIRKTKVHEHKYIESELQELDSEIAKLKKRVIAIVVASDIPEEQLIKIKPGQKSEKDESDDLKKIRELKGKIERCQSKQQGLRTKKQELALIDEQQIELFYETLNNFSEMFPNMSYQGKLDLLKSLIKQVTIKDLSPHWLQITVEWSEAVLDRPDVCLIWKNSPARNGEFTDEEKQIVKEIYAQCDRLEIMKRLPNRSWVNIRQLTGSLNLRRSPTNEPRGFPNNMCWNDIIAWGNQTDTTALASALSIPQPVQKTKSFLAEYWLHPAIYQLSCDELISEALVHGSARAIITCERVG